ncbi:hypothetical protein AB0M47_05070 [Hamadaea sp. NPDC051192]|uniref:hypothetical protein n=1 Tax=Hamadaea sp. NPDC051192 TaxID=3154940 RepID=UPI00344056E5
MALSHGMSALRIVEASFVALTAEPDPLALNGVPLARLRDQLLHAHTPLADKDWAWQRLVGLARDGEPAWVVATAGMALPGLARHARMLQRVRGSDRDEIEAGLVAGFLDAVARLDLDRPAIAARLVWAARRYAARSQPRLAELLLPDFDRHVDHRRCGHPDFVLVDAVALGVISDRDARLLAATRLEQASDDAVAAAMGLRLDTMRVRRHRAARKLVTALTSGVL